MKPSIRTKVVALFLLASIGSESAFAGLSSKGAAYYGGTTKDRDFPGAADKVEGVFSTSDDNALSFAYTLNQQKRVYAIPYRHFIDIEYGQKTGRRVGAAIGTAILISPVGLFMLFSKKRKHFVTIGYRDDEGKEQVAVFELGKDIVRTTLPILEARSGKKIEYQDEEAKKGSRG